MTVQAPLHAQRIRLVHQRHLVYRPVAARAAHALVDMYAVIEVHVVGQVVHPRPHQRFAGAEAFAYRLQDGSIRPDLRMAVHARFRRRNAGEAGVLNRSMAVPAVDAVSPVVVLMAERDGLRLRHVLPRRIRRALNFQRRPQQHRDDHHHCDDRKPRYCIRTSMKDLGHLVKRFHSAVRIRLPRRIQVGAVRHNHSLQ